MQISPEAFRQRFDILHLDPAESEALLSVLEPRNLAAGDQLLSHGEHNDTLYLVWSGRLQVTLTSDDTRLNVGEIEPGRWVGDFGFIDPGKAAADVTASEEATVLALSQTAMKTLYEQAANAASALLQALSLELARRLRTVSIHRVEKSAEDEYQLRGPEEQQQAGWLDTLCRIMGLRGGQT